MEEIMHCQDHGHFIGLAETVRSTSEDVKVIKDSLLGTLEKEGFISKFRQLEAKVDDLQTIRKDAKNVTTVAWVEFVLLLIGGIVSLVIKI